MHAALFPCKIFLIKYNIDSSARGQSTRIFYFFGRCAPHTRFMKKSTIFHKGNNINRMMTVLGADHSNIGHDPHKATKLPEQKCES